MKSIDVYETIRRIGTDAFVCNAHLEKINWCGKQVNCELPHTMIALSPNIKYISVPYEMGSKEHNILSKYADIRRYLSTPSFFTNDEVAFFWNEVAGADRYLVTIDGVTYQCNECRLPFTFRNINLEITIECINDSLDEVINSKNSFSYKIKKALIDKTKLNGGDFALGIVETAKHIDIVAPKSFIHNLAVKRIQLSVRLVDEYAFSDCSNLESITFGSSTVLGDYAFSRCTSLTNVTWNNIHQIGKGSFSECINLTDVILEDHLEEIPDDCFYRCYRMTNFKFPTSLKRIGNRSLRGCMALPRLEIPALVEEIGEQALTYLIIESIMLPSGLKHLSRGNLHNCTYLKEINIANNQHYSIQENALVEDDKIIVRYPPSCEGKSIIVGDNIIFVAEGAYRDCIYMQKFIGKSVVEIGDNAFADCSALEEVDLQSISYIGANAFAHCDNLRIVTIHSNKSDVNIEVNAFGTNKKLVIRMSEQIFLFAASNKNWKKYTSLIEICYEF
jgi:hypothetical protein